jgi:hypothetical protein
MLKSRRTRCLWQSANLISRKYLHCLTFWNRSDVTHNSHQWQQRGRKYSSR